MQKIKSLSQHHQDRVQLLQITDTHIFPHPGQTFDGVDTTHSLIQVIEHARGRCWPPDAILVTGDLVHDPVPAAYARLSTLLNTLDRPVYCIPGNHDEPALMRRVLESAIISMAKTILFDRWIIIMLDSFLAGTHAGCLAASELGFLEQVLADHPDRYALLCLHHPPVSVGSPWMDRMGLQNPADLFSIVDHHPQVRGILWGHIHQEFSGARGEIQLLATPSTCIQFTPGAESYHKDDKPPAYRHLQLHAGGEIETEVFNVPIRDDGGNPSPLHHDTGQASDEG